MVNKKPLIRAWRSRCLPIYHSNNSLFLPSLASTKSFCAEKSMVMNQHRTTKPRLNNSSTSNKINSNKYIMMTRITRSTMMSMAKHTTANKTTAQNNISNMTSNNMISSTDMTRLR